MKTISKKDIVILSVLGLIVCIIAMMIFLPLPEKVDLKIASDRTTVSRCLTLNGIQYLIRTNMPDAGSSLNDKNGNTICHQGGIDPTKSTGSCTALKLCIPVVTK